MQLVSFYLGVGLLLAVSAQLHGLYDPQKRFAAIAGILLLWPVFVLGAPDSFLRRATTVPADSRKKPLPSEVMVTTPPLTASEARRLKKTLETVEERVAYVEVAESALREFWKHGVPPAAYEQYRQARWRLSDNYDRERGILLMSCVDPTWLIGLSDEFVKSVARIDSKTQDEIVEALSCFSNATTTPVGEKINPLGESLRDFFLYELSDGRMLYHVSTPAGKITLVCFESTNGAGHA